ncbi:hypothetical protein RCL1_005867 [Eukaryota sp. TZLM3-RCL]
MDVQSLSGPSWTSEQRSAFFSALRRYGPSIVAISRRVPGKNPAQCASYLAAILAFQSTTSIDLHDEKLYDSLLVQPEFGDSSDDDVDIEITDDEEPIEDDTDIEDEPESIIPSRSKSQDEPEWFASFSKFQDIFDLPSTHHFIIKRDLLAGLISEQNPQSKGQMIALFEALARKFVTDFIHALIPISNEKFSHSFERLVDRNVVRLTCALLNRPFAVDMSEETEEEKAQALAEQSVQEVSSKGRKRRTGKTKKTLSTRTVTGAKKAEVVPEPPVKVKPSSTLGRPRSVPSLPQFVITGHMLDKARALSSK